MAIGQYGIDWTSKQQAAATPTPDKVLGIDFSGIKKAVDEQRRAQQGNLFGGSGNAGAGGTQHFDVANGFLGINNGYDQQLVNPGAYRSRTDGLKSFLAGRVNSLVDQENVVAHQPQRIAVQSAGGQAWQTGGQQALAKMLFDQANGQGPSAAQAQLQSGNDAAINAQMAMARSGGNPNAMRSAMFNAAGITQQNANAAAQLRAQEMMAGRQLYGDQLATARGQDMQNQQYNANMQQHLFDSQLQNNQFNASAKIQQAQAREQLLQNYIDRGFSMAEADRAADMALSNAMVGQNLYRLNAQMGGDAAAGAQALDLLKTGVSTTGQVLGASLMGKK